jgi:hypothetical protein
MADRNSCIQDSSDSITVRLRLPMQGVVLHLPAGQDQTWGPPCPLVSGFWGCFAHNYSGRGMEVTADLYLVSRLRVSGAVPSLPHMPSWSAWGLSLHLYSHCNINLSTHFQQKCCCFKFEVLPSAM